MVADITLTGEQEEHGGGRFKAETEELRGCWRIFFVAFVAFAVLLGGFIAYRVAFDWQPWKTAAERAAEARAAELAALPPIPDVVGLSLVDGIYELGEANYPRVLFFTTTVHGLRLTSDFAQTAPTDFNVGEAITLTKPPAGQPASETVSVWLGARPELPEGVAEDSFWFDHAATIADRGTYPCLERCHTTAFCEGCHELRLRGASSRFLADPERSPELADAVSEATGIPLDHVEAVFQGIGWYRVDVLVDDPGETNAEAEAARDAAVALFPAAYSAVPDADVILLRWVYSGSLDPIVEIGLERATYERLQWMGVEPDDIPWIVDRYAVIGGQR